MKATHPVSKAHVTHHRASANNNVTSILQKDLKKVGASISQTAYHAKDKAADLIGDAKEHAEDLIDEAKDKTVGLHNTVIGYVKDNPLTALGYSALAGFLIALFIRHK